jgi:hypothetical protein
VRFAGYLDCPVLNASTPLTAVGYRLILVAFEHPNRQQHLRFFQSNKMDYLQCPEYFWAYTHQNTRLRVGVSSATSWTNSTAKFRATYVLLFLEGNSVIFIAFIKACGICTAASVRRDIFSPFCGRVKAIRYDSRNRFIVAARI